MSNKNRSDVWNYFTKIDTDNASCTICKKVISYKSTITNLKGHLKRKHISIHFGLLKEPSKNQPDNESQENIFDESNEPRPSCSSTATSSKTALATSPVIAGSSSAVTASASVDPPPKQQRTISNYVGRKVTPEIKRKIDKDLMDLFIKDFQPFSIVEDVGFRKYSRWIPGYELPSRKTISSIMIPAAYHKHVLFIKDLLKEAPSVCITTDAWTSRDTESYMATTAHYIDNNFKLKSILLKFSSLPSSHTANNLAAELKDVLTEWNLLGKVNFAVSDNANNIVRAIEIP